MTDKIKTRQIPKRLPGDRLEYWHACKVEYFSNGVCQPKFTRSLNNRDLRQLAREAAKYVFAQFVWTRTTVPQVERFDFTKADVSFIKIDEEIHVAVNYLSESIPTGDNFDRDVFIKEFTRYWTILNSI